MSRHNPYHYSFNSPLVWKDPSGLAPEKEQDRLMSMSDLFGYIADSHDNYIQSVTEVDFAGTLVRAFNKEMDERANATQSAVERGRLGAEGRGDNGQKKMRIGYDYWTDGENYTREIYVEDDEGRFSICESGSIIDGEKFVEDMWMELKLEKGVDPDEWLTGIQMGLDTYGMVDQTFGGALAGVLSATIDLYRGNYVDAGMGLLSAVPIIGITGDLYKANKIAKALDKASDFLGPNAKRVDNLKSFDKNQTALIELAKESKKKGGIINDEAQILKNWSIEYKINFRGPEIHPNRNF